MRKLLNTLYVTTPEAYLSKDGLNVVISVQQEEVFRIPVINIEGMIRMGNLKDTMLQYQKKLNLHIQPH